MSSAGGFRDRLGTRTRLDPATVGLGVLAVAAGVGFLAAAVVQIVQLGGEAGAVERAVLGGNAYTFAVWLGLGVGLAIVGAQSR